MAFESLDFVYHPSRDVKKDVAYFTEVLGGRLHFAVEGMGALTRPGAAASFEGRKDF